MRICEIENSKNEMKKLIFKYKNEFESSEC